MRYVYLPKVELYRRQALWLPVLRSPARRDVGGCSMLKRRASFFMDDTVSAYLSLIHISKPDTGALSLQGFGKRTFRVIRATPEFLAWISTLLGGPKNQISPALGTQFF